jgi:hypothetical protein
MADEPTVETLRAELEGLKGQLTDVVKDRDRLLEQKREWKSDASNVSAAERAELETLRQKQKAADEEHAKAAGQWDKLRAEKEKEVEAAQQALQAEREARVSDMRRTAFERLPELFGADGKTILTPRLAHHAFGERVVWQPGENGTTGRFVVTDDAGEPILENGAPVSLAAGLERVIMADAERDAILRSPSATGSGSGGGHDSLNTKTATRAELAQRAAAGDRTAIEAFRAGLPTGQVSGAYWDKKAAQQNASQK